MPRCIGQIQHLNTRGRKAKGRKLQDWVKDKLCSILDLSKDEVYTATMSTKGTDVRLVTKKLALERFPWALECKNQEIYRHLYVAWYQALENAKKDGLMPAMVIKMNYNPPLIVMDAEMFLKHFYASSKDEALDNKEAENARTTEEDTGS